MADVTFASKGATGRVHVLDPERGPKAWLPEGWTIGESIMRLPVGVTLCGREATGLHGWGTTATFEDGELCVRCVGLYPGDGADLFHPDNRRDPPGL